MLMLLFQVEDERWAIAATAVVAVMPNVSLQTMPHSHSAVAGLLNYHDEILPAIDVSALLGNEPAPPLLSTRIVIVEGIVSGSSCKVALMVDRAGETIQLTERISLPGQSLYAAAAFKAMDGEMIQQLAIAPLLKQAFSPQAENLPQRTMEPAFELGRVN